jgi:hypothetical protein
MIQPLWPDPGLDRLQPGARRAGLVGPDGATHAGAFDLSYARILKPYNIPVGLLDALVDLNIIEIGG